MKKKIIIALLILIILLLLAFLRFVIGGPEDSWICDNGEWIKHGNPSAAKPIEPCAQVETTTNEANITVDLPKQGETIGMNFSVKGSARVFENQFNWSVLDATTQKEITAGTAYANAADMGLFGPFEIEIDLPATTSPKIILQVLDYSAKDGSVIDLVKIPLNFDKDTNAGNTYQVYFSNNKLDPQVSCVKVFPLNRSEGTSGLSLRQVLNLLLQGLTEKEKEDGYFTSIPAGVKINSIKEEGSTVEIDFDSGLETGVAGSCLVTAIRAQIYWTVINFNKNARSVVISVNGNKDALQP